MSTSKSYPTITLLIACMLVAFSGLHCTPSESSSDEETNEPGTDGQYPIETPYPFSDPYNSQNWNFREDLSDEFSGTSIDETKWHIAGAPNLGEQLGEEEGEVLMDGDCNCPYENYTVGGLISKKNL